MTQVLQLSEWESNMIMTTVLNVLETKVDGTPNQVTSAEMESARNNQMGWKQKAGTENIPFMGSAVV